MGLRLQSLPEDGAVARIGKFLGMLAGFYILGMIGLFAFQRSMLYLPSHDYVPLSEAHANKAFQEISVRTEDGLDLKGWYAPATSKPFTIVFFHGNADCSYTASPIADPYIAAGYGFLLAEYRGYSGLPGKPTENGLYADGRAYMKWLMAQGVRSENMILFGHSLGTGVAVEMAGEFPVGGVMLLAPFLSMPDVAQFHYPYLPAKYLVLDRYDNAKKIRNIHAPLLVVNGAIDEVIPPAQGKRLFDLANEPKQFQSLSGHGHNDSFDEFAPLSLDWAGRLR